MDFMPGRADIAVPSTTSKTAKPEIFGLKSLGNDDRSFNEEVEDVVEEGLLLDSRELTRQNSEQMEPPIECPTKTRDGMALDEENRLRRTRKRSSVNVCSEKSFGDGFE